MSKICRRCGVKKPLSEFWRHRSSRDGYRSACAVCEREWHRDYNDKNRESRNAAAREYWNERRDKDADKARRLYRDYGITLEEYHTRLSGQGGKCANPRCENDTKLCVDHDHSCCPERHHTCGKCVRGILCGSCNRTLGHANDDPERLRGLAEYLEVYLA